MELADAASASFAVGLDAARRAAPPGIAVRALRDGDYAPMADVRNAAARADGDRVTTADRIRADLELDDAPPTSRVILAEADGRLVGWVRATDRGVAPDVGRILNHRGGVDPDWRGRGIGRALLAGAQALLRELNRLVPKDAPPMFEAWVPATGTATARLLRHAGYAIENWNIDMLRPSLDDLPPVDLPPGIESRPVHAEDVFPIMLAWDDAMRDHPGWAPLSDHPHAAAAAAPPGRAPGRSRTIRRASARLPTGTPRTSARLTMISANPTTSSGPMGSPSADRAPQDRERRDDEGHRAGRGRGRPLEHPEVQRPGERRRHDGHREQATRPRRGTARRAGRTGRRTGAGRSRPTRAGRSRSRCPGCPLRRRRTKVPATP